MVYGVVGVTIWTEDLDRLRRFYRDVLRLPLHSDHGDFLAFRFGEMRLNIGYHHQVSGPTREPYRVMVNLGVKDIHAEHRRLLEQGVEFIRPPEWEEWGGWVATFKDPDGNVLQLLEMP
jgi:predicted enzyme related to lactoylglutathione lyase